MGPRPHVLDERAILYEDDDLVAIDKPEGIASQSTDPRHPDDVGFELARIVSARDGHAPRLGVHQRLDRETSGVMVFAKSERGNRALAEQFEARTIRKEYVAGVRGYRGGARRLEHRLSDLERGKVHVAPRGGKLATADVAPIERRGDRALLGVHLHTGRTHQIRVQLAAIGAPIAGDALYGNQPAERTMLHASRLVLRRPSDGTELDLRSKVPACFRRFLAGADGARLDDTTALRQALARAFRRRVALASARDDERAIDAYRLLHGGGDGVPDLAIDVYADFAVAQLYRALEPDVEDAVLDEIHRLGFEGVYLKRRPELASAIVDPRRAEIAPHEALRGRSAPAPLVVRENGLPYEVALGDGLSTGLFLDQRENRRRVREAAEGLRVLNLFAYTGAFSVAAAAGGARSVTTVDAAKPALDRAARNFELGSYASAHRIVRGDVFEFLDEASRDEPYDLVVCDPPTYSTTRHGRWTSGDDWIRLAAAVFDVCADGADVVFCSNDRRMSTSIFRRRILAAAAESERDPAIRAYEPPVDFPRAPGGEPTMKTSWVKLRSASP